jgi:hypothetical protein
MKTTLKLLMIVVLSLTLQANSLTKQQQTKLNSSIVKVSNNIFTSLPYSSVGVYTSVYYFFGYLSCCMHSHRGRWKRERTRK